MLRHVVMFRWKDAAEQEQIETALAQLQRLPELIDAISSYSFGRDLGLADGNYDFALVAEFENEDDYRTYAAHPEHLRVIRDHLQALIGDRAVVQFAA